jgi:hypothetical protein
LSQTTLCIVSDKIRKINIQIPTFFIS